MSPFDVLDVGAGRFWGVERRDALVSRMGLSCVPRLAQGRLTLRDVLAVVEGPSACGPGTREGLYLRREEGSWLDTRAKVVRAAFTESMADHWTTEPLVGNRWREEGVS